MSRRRSRLGLLGRRRRPNRRVRRRSRAKGRGGLWVLAALALLAIALVTGDEGVGRDSVRMGAADADFEELDLPEVELPEVALPELPSVDLFDAMRSEPFLLARVDFLGLRALDERALARRTGLSAHAPLLDVDPASVCRNLLAMARIERCVATRLPPDRLVVRIVEREPIAATPEGLGVDRFAETFPITPTERERLPTASGRLEPAIALLAAARARGIRLERVVGRGDAEVAFHVVGSQIRILARRPFADDLDRYARVSTERTFAEMRAGELDLRFRGSAFFRDLPQDAFATNHGGKTP